MSEIKKCVLAYSGGLDTSIIIPWLKENYGCEVIAVSGNVGQADELEGLEEKALKTGASKLYVLDLIDDYCENYIFCFIIPMFYNKEEVSFKTFTHIKTPEQLPLLVSSMYMMESKSSKLVGVYILDVGELYFEESLYLGKSEKSMHWERFTSWNRAVRGYTLHLLGDCIVL